MRIIVEHWKYIFRNIWFVLPFSVIPALFLALSIDYSGVENFLSAFFTGKLDFEFTDLFRVWSLLRYDSALGAVYSVCALVSTVFFTALLLAFVEKHMRIGKRTFSGVAFQLGNQILTVGGVILLYFAIYEIWALLLSAMLYTIAAIGTKAITYVLMVFVILLFFAALLYLVSILYLWLPCMQLTGMHPFNAFLYSYRLLVGVRGKLLLSMLLSFVPAFLVLWGASFLPDLVTIVLAFVLHVFLYLSFTIRAEVFYFDADKLDREDLLRSYREL